MGGRPIGCGGSTLQAGWEMSLTGKRGGGTRVQKQVILAEDGKRSGVEEGIAINFKSEVVDGEMGENGELAEDGAFEVGDGVECGYGEPEPEGREGRDGVNFYAHWRNRAERGGV